MNKSVKWTILIAIAFVLLIVGASVAYSKLGADFESPQLAVVENETEADGENAQQTETSDETVAEEQSETEKTEQEIIQAPNFTM